MKLLLGLSLAFSGIMAGIYVSGLIHDHRIADLSAARYAATHRMRDKSFRRVMPVLALATLGLLLTSTAVVLAAGTSRLLGAAAVLLTAIDIALTVIRQLPLNRTVESWTEGTISADWAQVRDRWTRHQCGAGDPWDGSIRMPSRRAYCRSRWIRGSI